MTTRSDERRRAVMAEGTSASVLRRTLMRDARVPTEQLNAVEGSRHPRPGNLVERLKGDLVYLAGPYTMGNNNHNTRRACEHADVLVTCGVWPVVPHMSHLWDTISQNEYPPDFWYNYDLKLLFRCDAMVVMPGSEGSKGVQLERDFCTTNSIPVYDWDELFRPTKEDTNE